MVIKEYLDYRQELLDQSTDDNSSFSESILLSQVLPSMLDAKLIDSEDYNNSYFKSSPEKMKINAYCVNESGERLQLFLIDETSTSFKTEDRSLQISTKSHYDSQFKRGIKFLTKAIKGHLNDEIQDSSPVKALISKISSSDGANQFDVVEFFLISTTATVSLLGAEPQPKRFDFDSEELSINYLNKNRERQTKELLIKKRLIDLNFLYNVIISQGNREALKVDFESMFGSPLHAIKAADEECFESYLCVLPATYIAKLYKEHSSRLLEKNVRSFLQFKGVNKGIKETIRKEPEKFVAYNNGLTITATSAEIEVDSLNSSIKSLTDFQIVNGGQTTATIYFSQKEGFDISKVKVMAKINVAKNTSEEELEALISNISTYSNAQSRVSKVDLRSRNPQLVKIKSLCDSVMTPTGLKWFFERAKGEFNTKLRISGNNKARLQKEYPTDRRFSKEQLAKYYSAWGDQPYMVKKGGEKVFRYFIERLCGEGTSKKALEIDRSFYEELIAKIIIFRKLEKIYGQGKNSMGQLRSAAVPYTISVLYKYTDGNKKGNSFDLLKIWLNEGLEDDLESYFKDLLTLVNDLIKKYSQSDDYGEYSKKVELWDSIIKSSEIMAFMDTNNSTKLMNKYCVSKEELKKRDRKSKKNKDEVDFSNISRTAEIFDNGEKYYISVLRFINIDITDTEERKFSKIKASIQNKEDIEDADLDFERDFIQKVRKDSPEVFDKIILSNKNKFKKTLDYIIKIYNDSVSNGKDIQSEFDRISSICEAKGIKYSMVFVEIGKQLENGIAPSIGQIYFASRFVG